MSDRVGIVYGMPDAEYHSGPELSSTGAKLLLDVPARFAEYREHRQSPKTEFDLGHAAHRLLLGAGAELRVVDFANWQTKAAQTARKEAYAEGVTPLLPSQFAAAEALAEKVRAHQVAGPLFRDGEPEVSLFWTCPESGVRCRARVDWLTKWVDGRDCIVDLKSGGEGIAAPAAIAKAAWNYRRDVQAAMYLAGAVATGLVGPDAIFLHVHAENVPPHLVTVAQLSQDALALGHRDFQRAAGRFSACQATGVWDGYADHSIVSIELPDWAYREEWSA